MRSRISVKRNKLVIRSEFHRRASGAISYSGKPACSIRVLN
jgi:hypothetical protein